MAWDDWFKRNLSFTGLSNIGKETLTKADFTPNNWILTQALPWYQRSVIEPGAAYLTRPIRQLGEDKPTWQKVGDFVVQGKAAGFGLAPDTALALSKRSTEPYQKNINQYREWDAPSWNFGNNKYAGWLPVNSLGLKGAAEIAVDPLTYIGAEGAGAVAKGGLKAASKAAAKRGALGTAEALAKGSRMAGKFSTIGRTIDNPIGAAYGGVKGLRKPATRALTATGRNVTPEGAIFRGAMEGIEEGISKVPQQIPEMVQKSLTETGTMGSPVNAPPGVFGEATGHMTTLEGLRVSSGGVTRTGSMTPTGTMGTGMPPPGGTPPMAGVSATGPIGQPVTGQALRDKFTNVIKDIDVKAARKVQDYLRNKALKKRVSRSMQAEVGKTGESRVASSMAELKGEMPSMDLPPLRDAFHPQEVDELYDMAAHAFTAPNRHFDKVNTWKGLTDLLDNGKLPTEGVEKLFREVYGDDFVQMLYKKAAEVAKAKVGLSKIPGIVAREITSDMRIAETILDASNLMQQNFINTVSHPLKTAKGFTKAELSIFGRQDIADAAIRAFEIDPNAHRMAFMKGVRGNVPYVSLGGSSIKPVGKMIRDEFYEGGWLMHNVPGIKQVTEASERSFATMGNISRFDKYKAMSDSWAKLYPDIDEGMKTAVKTGQGLDPEIFYKDAATTARTAKAIKMLDQLGEWSNITTGRGNLPKFLQKHAETLNIVMFASRLMAARVGYIPKGLVFSITNPVIRKEFARELVSLTIFTMGTLYTAKALGATVEMDPRSTDFGKIRVGNTRIQLMGGFQPYIRYTAQIITGQRKSASGRIYTSSRGEDFARFLRSKESPAAGLVHDIWSGETFIGEDVDLSKETAARTAWQKFVPLFVQDVYDAVKQEGASGVALAAPGFFGAGVTSYGPSKSTSDAKNAAAKAKYGLDWDTLGKRMGTFYQMELEKTDPTLKAQKAAEDEKRLRESGIPETDWERWNSVQDRISNETKKAMQAADLALRERRITPYEFRLRVDEIQGNARYARDIAETDPQYASVLQFLQTPSGKEMAIGDIAYNEYVSRVFDNSLTNDVGKYDYAGAEKRKQEIRAKYGDQVYQYIQQKLTLNQDDTESMAALRNAREMLRPYWQIEDQAWAAYPQLKSINDQIELISSTDPDQGKALLKRYPTIVAIRKRIALMKQRMKLTNPMIAQALVFYKQ